MMKDLIIISSQFLLLGILYLMGTWTTEILNLPIPGNVIGMMLLLLLLVTRIIPLSWVDKGAGIFVRHLGFFFIPICVGIMAVGPLSPGLSVSLTVTIVVSTMAGIAVTGKVFQYSAYRKEK